MSNDRLIIPDGPKAGRQRCCIMGCNRTFKDEGFTVVMCGGHWRMAPAHMRKRHAKLVRRYKREFGNNGFWDYPPGSEKRLAALRLAKMRDRAWDMCRKAVEQRSLGI